MTIVEEEVTKGGATFKRRSITRAATNAPLVLKSGATKEVEPTVV